MTVPRIGFRRSSRPGASRRWAWRLLWLSCWLVPSVAVAVRAPSVGLPETLSAEPGITASPLRATPEAQPLTPRQLPSGFSGGLRDLATNVPARLWGARWAPGAAASPAAAERHARALLQELVASLAPGALPADFQLVANELGPDGVRVVGFVQTHLGMRVVGGQLSMRFKGDALVMVASEALPYVAVSLPRWRARPASAQASLLRATQRRGLTEVSQARAADPVVLPLLGPHAVLGYEVVTPLAFEVAGQPGLAYARVSDGTVIAMRATAVNATAVVEIQAVDRSPQRPRVRRPAANLTVSIDGAAMRTDATGRVTWAQGTPTLQATLEGSLADVKTAQGNAATFSHVLADGSTLLWDGSHDEALDAQLQAYVHLGVANAYVRGFAPGLALLNQPIVANVNGAGECNASFDGTAVNFLRSSKACENTGRLADVVYHEFGHAVHAASIVPGVGAYEGGLSEGVADFLAVSITGDAGVARGFYRSELPLRDLDAPNKEAMWPRDIGRIHQTGIIIGGALWDLRKALIGTLGEVPGVAHTNQLYFAALQRATSIPTVLPELLVSDDDDGNLENGTPNECAIREAFARHGLRLATGEVVAQGAVTGAGTVPLQFDLRDLGVRCAGDDVTAVRVYWKGQDGVWPEGEAAASLVAGAPLGTQRWTYGLHVPPRGVVEYWAIVTFSDGSTLRLPDNLGDTSYQVYAGATMPLYCTGFETDPFAEGWAVAAGSEPTSWQWGRPSAAAYEPPDAFAGAQIMALGLGARYGKQMTSKLTAPVLNTAAYSDVRLQFRRWLTVEDGHFDKARILVNGAAAWTNFDSNMGDGSATHTLDREWRFVDVPLRRHFRGAELRLAFDLTTDEGLEFGGWNLDELCVVVDPDSICGDGKLTGDEECDEGAANGTADEGCRADCFLPGCGDAIVNGAEACDDGLAGSSLCTPKCTFRIEVAGGGVGCAAGAADGMWPSALLVLAWRRRRRKRAGRRATVR